MRQLVKLLPALGKFRCLKCQVPFWAANPHEVEFTTSFRGLTVTHVCNWVCEYCWATTNRRDMIPIFYKHFHNKEWAYPEQRELGWHPLMDALLENWED